MNQVFQKADKTSANIGMIVSNVKREERAGGWLGVAATPPPEGRSSWPGRPATCHGTLHSL